MATRGVAVVLGALIGVGLVFGEVYEGSLASEKQNRLDRRLAELEQLVIEAEQVERQLQALNDAYTCLCISPDAAEVLDRLATLARDADLTVSKTSMRAGPRGEFIGRPVRHSTLGISGNGDWRRFTDFMQSLQEYAPHEHALMVAHVHLSDSGDGSLAYELEVDDARVSWAE
ncbi:MAG: hypothetical protein JNJ54_20345 [Myxococcaceae bacterium]|nr:hypothetical protein [Myxococcaceae bacterium]